MSSAYELDWEVSWSQDSVKDCRTVGETLARTFSWTFLSASSSSGASFNAARRDAIMVRRFPADSRLVDASGDSFEPRRLGSNFPGEQLIRSQSLTLPIDGEPMCELRASKRGNGAEAAPLDSAAASTALVNDQPLGEAREVFYGDAVSSGTWNYSYVQEELQEVGVDDTLEV